MTDTDPIDRLPPEDSPAPDVNPHPLAKVAPPPAIIDNPLAIIADAVQSGNLDVAVLEKLSALQERWEDRQAEKAFNDAMTSFQSECPVVGKNKRAEIQSKKGGNSSYGYSYAGYAFIMQEIRPVLTRYDLSVSFSSTQDKGGPVRVLCKISHKAGHSQTTTFDCPVPSMNVNETQKMGAAQTYGRRYALCAALNIVVAGEDDDAACVTPKAVANPVPAKDAPQVGTRQERATEKAVKERWAKLHKSDGPESTNDTRKRFACWYEETVLGGGFMEGDSFDWAKAEKHLDEEDANRGT